MRTYIFDKEPDLLGGLSILALSPSELSGLNSFFGNKLIRFKNQNWEEGEWWWTVNQSER